MREENFGKGTARETFFEMSQKCTWQQHVLDFNAIDSGIFIGFFSQ